MRVEVKPEQAHEELRLFVGEWHSEGEWKHGPFGPPGPFTARVCSEWLPGGFFLLFRSESDGPAGKSYGCSVWGHDPKAGTYTHHSFGSSGEAKLETGTVDGNAWTFLGAVNKDGQTVNTRFIDRAVTPAELRMTGETRVGDSDWSLIMEGTARKVASAPGRDPFPSPSPVGQRTSEHEKLDFFVGQWHSKGELRESPLGLGGPFTQTVDCQFVPGRFFLLFRSRQDGPMGDLASVGVWGYSVGDRAYTHHSFNSLGSARLETGSFDGDAWHFWAEFEDNSQLIKTRFIDRVASPNRLEMTGEISIDGAPWVTVMEGTAERVGG